MNEENNVDSDWNLIILFDHFVFAGVERRDFLVGFDDRKKKNIEQLQNCLYFSPKRERERESCRFLSFDQRYDDDEEEDREK